MTKTAVIHQPDFLPYLGFLDRLLNADVFVLLDSVQYVNATSRSWTNRDKIKTPQGPRWITVGVKKAARDTAIKDIELSADERWRSDHLNLLSQNYRKAPGFGEIFPLIKALYSTSYQRLADFNKASIELLMELFGIQVELVWASTLKATGKSNELLVAILQEVGAKRYVSGVGARAYFNPEPFVRAGVEVEWQNFVHPVYPQLHGEFIPFLSSIDLLFCCGIDRSRQILRKL